MILLSRRYCCMRILKSGTRYMILKAGTAAYQHTPSLIVEHAQQCHTLEHPLILTCTRPHGKRHTEHIVCGLSCRGQHASALSCLVQRACVVSSRMVLRREVQEGGMFWWDALMDVLMAWSNWVWMFRWGADMCNPWPTCAHVSSAQAPALDQAQQYVLLLSVCLACHLIGSILCVCCSVVSSALSSWICRHQDQV